MGQVRFQARPGPVLGCDREGTCQILQLEGSLDLEVLYYPFPGSGFPPARITGSSLRLHPVGRLFAAFDDVVDFPPAAAPRLEELVIEGDLFGWRLSEPPGSSYEVALELRQGGEGTPLLLRGTYTEAETESLEPTRFDVAGVLFDATASPPLSPPVLILANRFEVQVAWQDSAGGAGSGTPVVLNENAGEFWFYSPVNPELMVKVIDACDSFGRWWFFAAGLTNVGVEIRVTYFRYPQQPTKTYVNAPGVPFEPILDTEGFPCDP